MGSEAINYGSAEICEISALEKIVLIYTVFRFRQRNDTPFVEKTLALYLTAPMASINGKCCNISQPQQLLDWLRDFGHIHSHDRV